MLEIDNSYAMNSWRTFWIENLIAIDNTNYVKKNPKFEANSLARLDAPNLVFYLFFASGFIIRFESYNSPNKNYVNDVIIILIHIFISSKVSTLCCSQNQNSKLFVCMQNIFDIN